MVLKNKKYKNNYNNKTVIMKRMKNQLLQEHLIVLINQRENLKWDTLLSLMIHFKKLNLW